MRAKQLLGKSLHSLDKVATSSIIYSVFIFITTVQAQDFKDVEGMLGLVCRWPFVVNVFFIPGDIVVGRKTLPLVYPSLARPTLMLAIAIWSFGLSYMWSLSGELAMSFIALGAAVGFRFLIKTSCKADQRSFYIYNVRYILAYRKQRLTNGIVIRSGFRSLMHSQHISASSSHKACMSDGKELVLVMKLQG